MTIFLYPYVDHLGLLSGPALREAILGMGIGDEWVEYGTIRAHLVSGMVSENDYYGCFAAEYLYESQLSVTDIVKFIGSGSADVFGVSPFFDQTAIFRNCFQQGDDSSPGTGLELCEILVNALGLPKLDGIVMHSQNSVHKNYFVASGRFWMQWLEIADRLHNYFSHGAHANFGDRVLQVCGSPVSAKVFAMRCIVNLMLAADGRWTVKTHNPVHLPYTSRPEGAFPEELISLDALKIAHSGSGYEHFMYMFDELRANLMSRCRHSVRV